MVSRRDPRSIVGIPTRTAASKFVAKNGVDAAFLYVRAWIFF
jgi:hypothetical protein